MLCSCHDIYDHDSHQMCRVKETEKDIQKHAYKTKEWHKDRRAKMADVEKHADKA
jgi:hypothetical protein